MRYLIVYTCIRYYYFKRDLQDSMISFGDKMVKWLKQAGDRLNSGTTADNSIIIYQEQT